MQTLTATTTALCSGPTEETINESEHIFIGKYPFDALNPVVYSEQNKI